MPKRLVPVTGMPMTPSTTFLTEGDWMSPIPDVMVLRTEIYRKFLKEDPFWWFLQA
jgi:hypothetical protein